MTEFKKYNNKLSFQNRLGRLIWGIYRPLFFRPFSAKVFKEYRNIVLRLFGAKIGNNSIIHSTVKIWAPWNLEVGEYTCIGPHVECYSVDKIILGNKVTISQYACLYTASHNINILETPLITAPIQIENMAWVAAKVYVGMNVKVGEGAVIGATASVFKDVKPWTIVGGNPAKIIKEREIIK